ncbi:MAG: sulfotransferase [Prochlorococcaceae cyanobacterium]
MSLNRRLRKVIEAGLKGEHQQSVDGCGRSLPNFIIIGAAKSATTTLTTILPRHPQVFISKPKEPKFFGRRYDKGWDWYAGLFGKGKRQRLRGEGSTMYASALGSFQHAPALMHRYLPDLKLVYVVRHPLDRIESQWRHRSGRKRGTPRFEAMLRSRHLRKLIVGCSLYHERLQSFRAFYPDRQIHCLTFEDLVRQPQATLTELLEFLGASTSPEHLQLLLDHGQLPRVNEAGDKGRRLIPPPTWPPRLRRMLAELVRPDAEQMLAYMNKPLCTWEL